MINLFLFKSKRFNKISLYLIVIATLLFYLLYILIKTDSLIIKSEIKPALNSFISEFNNITIDDTSVMHEANYILHFKLIYGDLKLTGIKDYQMEKAECYFLFTANIKKNKYSIYVPFKKVNGKWKVVYKLIDVISYDTPSLKDIYSIEKYNSLYQCTFIDAIIIVDTIKKPYMMVSADMVFVCNTASIKNFLIFFRNQMIIEKITINGVLSQFSETLYRDPFDPENIGKRIIVKNNAFIKNDGEESVIKLSIAYYVSDTGCVEKQKVTSNIERGKYEDYYICEPELFFSTGTNEITSFLPVPLIPSVITLDTKTKCRLKIISKDNLLVDTAGIDENGFIKGNYTQIPLILSKLKHKTINIDNVQFNLVFDTSLSNVYIDKITSKIIPIITATMVFCEYLTGIKLKDITPTVSYIFVPYNLQHQKRMMNANHTIILSNKDPFFINTCISSKDHLLDFIYIISHELIHCWFGNYISITDIPGFGLLSQDYTRWISNWLLDLCYDLDSTMRYYMIDTIEDYCESLLYSMERSLPEITPMKYEFYTFDESERELLNKKEKRFSLLLWYYLGVDNFRKVFKECANNKKPLTVQSFRKICEKYAGISLEVFFYDFLYTQKTNPVKYLKDDLIHKWFKNELMLWDLGKKYPVE